MRKALTALVPLTLVAGLLTSCGGGSGSDTSAYCDDLKADKAQFESMSGGDISQLGDAFDKMHKLASEAPDEVKDDWKTVDDALTSIEDALKSAGLSVDDLAAMQKGQMPKGVDMAKLQELTPKLQEISGADMAKATEAIDKNAQDVCGVTLGGS